MTPDINLSTLNYGAIILAGLVSFAIGALWYSPALFAKPWQEDTGIGDDGRPSSNNSNSDKGNNNAVSSKNADDNAAVVYGGSLFLMLLMSFALALTLQEYAAHHELNWQVGASKGLFYGIFFAATSIGINYLYQRKSLRLFLIDASYQILFLTISGIILATWR